MSDRKLIIVGGSAYADIDVLACVAAYKQLQNIIGKKALAVITGAWNQTIPSSIRTWDIEIEPEFNERSETCQFVLVDFSDPKYMEKFVLIDQVVEVFDHHFGHEEFWHHRIGVKATIEPIGACATLIWEKFKEYNIENQISSTNANLLYTAIFANTLDFRSKVTHERDIKSAQEIAAYTTLPHDWKKQYYHEVCEGFNQDLVSKIYQDTKTIQIENKTFLFGQIELWNAGFFLKRERENLLMLPRLCGNEIITDWIVNLVSIEEGKCYLFTNSKILKDVLLKITSGVVHDEYFLVTPNLWLRKELLRELYHTLPLALR